MIDINNMSTNNKKFLDLIKRDVFAEIINVFTMGGKPMFIVNGATAIANLYR